MQTDPIGYKDGVNWYDYVDGDPINRSDPTGLCTYRSDSKSFTSSNAICKVTAELTTSEKGKDAIKRGEGFREKVYRDTKGNLTVGYGHKVVKGDNLKVGDKITKEQANSLFSKDLAKAEQAVRQAAGNTPLSVREFDAVTDLAFNGGARAIGNKSPMLSAALDRGDYGAIGKNLAYDPALPNRNFQRQKIFFTGNYDD